MLERGITDAHLVATKFLKSNPIIDYAFSSPANRALHTAMIVLRNLDFDFNNFRVTNDLYDFSGESVLRFLRGLPNKLNTVLVFGHNYAFTTLANTLGDSCIENVPTAGLVQLTFQEDNWSGIAEGKTEKQIFPKQLR